MFINYPNTKRYTLLGNTSSVCSLKGKLKVKCGLVGQKKKILTYQQKLLFPTNKTNSVRNIN